MKSHHCPETDSLYVDSATRPGVESREVMDQVVLDFDADDHLVRIDIDHASRVVDIETMEPAVLPLGGLAARQ